MIVIIKGCGNNIASVQFALSRLGFTSVLTDDPEIIQRASHVILPGVGHASHAMDCFNKKGLSDVITNLTVPVLGICLGMQLLYEFTEEGNTPCLGIIPGTVKKIVKQPLQPVPHMGWNNLKYLISDFTINEFDKLNSYVYFVHSFAAPVNKYTIAITEYTEKISAIVKYKNFIGMQFHPERSGIIGQTFLKKFINKGSI